MPEPTPARETSFVLQQKMTDSTRQPLELYHLSHDLRGPLNSILGFAELLLEGIEGPLNEVQSADIAAIYQSARNLLHLINSVVDLSKLEANRLSFDFGSVELNQVLEDISTFDFEAHKPDQVELIVKLPETTLSVWGDQNRIDQMIKSLLKFAFKLKKRGPVKLAAASDKTAVTLRVEVEEVALPAETLAELFELVVKIDAVGRSELGRGGLDLPLARYLAEKHQGRIWTESEANTGTIFYLSLPLEGTVSP